MIHDELTELYNKNLSKGMNKDDAYTEAYAIICNKYEDGELEAERL